MENTTFEKKFVESVVEFETEHNAKEIFERDFGGTWDI